MGLLNRFKVFIVMQRYLLYLLLLWMHPAQSQIQWTMADSLSPGLIHYTYTGTWDTSAQQIHLFEVALEDHRFDLLYSDTTRYRTSDFAKHTQALIAVNAGFFDMRDGGLCDL